MALMASSSSSFFSTNPKEKYEVFLSFRGEDTRDNFTSHLYEALCRSKINTFIDDRELCKGDEISPSLLSAIEGSMISVVIFSQGYASSRWCLEELVKILQCKDKYGQIVIPVFYHVEPSHVRNQTGAFADGLAELGKRYKDSLQTWEAALREVANLSGFDSKVIRPESQLIKDIIKDILNRLDDRSPPVDDGDLVGVDLKAEYIEWLLCIGFGGVRKLGIWGTGGIGKTTLAKAVFKRISNYFESSYFVQNIREESEKGRLRELHNELIFAILGDNYSTIESTITKNRLGRKKVFIVFDDVTHFQQIEDLIGDFDYLGSGSRIIITTRDKHILEICEMDKIYETKLLSYDDSLQLFSKSAFRQNYPKESYVKLSEKIVKYAGGIPLALKILGRSLYKGTEQLWQSTINELGKVPPMDILKVLEISYHGLDKARKDMFLDIACFHKGKNINYVKDILDACGFNSEIGVQILIEKSLITISSFGNVEMHDLIQEMGREIVQQESIYDPGKRSRLWNHNDIYPVLTENTGTEAILGICLDMSKIEEIHLNHNAFTNLRNLKFLKLYDLRNQRFLKLYESFYTNKVHGFEAIKSNFRELRYFFFDGYPAKSLPSNCRFKNLVQLLLPGSNIEQLCLGNQNLDNLKLLDLSGSRHLFKISDLSLAPNLEQLDLQDCVRLQEISSSDLYLNKLVYLDLGFCRSFNSLQSIIFSKSLIYINLSGIEIQELPPSICYLPRLVYLKLDDCSRLEYLPGNICELKSLEYLSVTGCPNLKMVPELPCKIRKLSLCETGVRELPSSTEYLIELSALFLTGCSRLESLPNGISNLKSLRELCLSGCSRLESLPNGICKLKSLRKLHLCGCSRLESLPNGICKLKYLEQLYLTGCSRLESLPNGICKLKYLERLDLSGCSQLDKLPEQLGNLKALTWLYATETAIREVPFSIRSLKNLRQLYFGRYEMPPPLRLDFQLLHSLPLAFLDLTGCCITELPYNLGQLLSSILVLYLGGNNFERVPASIKDLTRLHTLVLSNCERLRSLPELPLSLGMLKALSCTSLEAPSVLFNLRRLADSFLDSELDRHWLYIYFPGSEIPNWFNFQSTGSLLHLPLGWCSDNFRRSVVCVVVSLGGYKGESPLLLAWDLIVDQKPIRMGKTLYSNEHIRYFESDHLLIQYNTGLLRSISGEFSKLYNKEAFIQFYFVSGYTREKVLHGWQMKKCGVHLF